MKINVNDTEKLAKAIVAAEGTRVRARTISVPDIQGEVKRLEVGLAKILHKKDWSGFRAVIDLHAGKFPGAYRGVPLSTQFWIERTSSGWFVTKIWRGSCKASRKHEARFTEEQKVKIAASIEENF